jgi:hypothetical protein
MGDYWDQMQYQQQQARLSQQYNQWLNLNNLSGWGWTPITEVKPEDASLLLLIEEENDV